MNLNSLICPRYPQNSKFHRHPAPDQHFGQDIFQGKKATVTGETPDKHLGRAPCCSGFPWFRSRGVCTRTGEGAGSTSLMTPAGLTCLLLRGTMAKALGGCRDGSPRPWHSALCSPRPCPGLSPSSSEVTPEAAGEMTHGTDHAHIHTRACTHTYTHARTHTHMRTHREVLSARASATRSARRPSRPTFL